MILGASLISACGSSSDGSGSGTAQAASSGSGTGAAAATDSAGPGGGPGLAWQAPTENTDGSSITDLAGYNIHYGTASLDYTQVIQVANPSLTQYAMQSLSPGTYYFALTAYTASGTESSFSNEASITVN
ncbi:MAG TPA: fibronectin type III domain-containing protein [Steroidobacteraceae bacterium]|nr:fibronectin type III domain-containing protein [Steroidobacteraceae bacterium]